ncbi:uncharacterized protein BDV17DRAFT_287968 [Aspergillus undulatus]|uniref:uncharacterized protein n=1 Tax=Aspergillus undulatus TaxID=1810928 RepID=UPI003CCDC717
MRGRNLQLGISRPSVPPVQSILEKKELYTNNSTDRETLISPKKAAAFNLKITYHNWRQLPPSIEKEYGLIYAPTLPSLLEISDIISINCSLNTETTNLLGPAEFSLMKYGMFIINTARGAVIDEEALIAALEFGKGTRAGLDVFPDEPNVNEYFRGSDRVILQPHLGGLTDMAFQRAETECFENVRALFRDGRPVSPVIEIEQEEGMGGWLVNKTTTLIDANIPNKQGPIIIVGAGIFGLSTALHLARRGYNNVTVFDKQPYDKTLYSYLKGCDAASAGTHTYTPLAHSPGRLTIRPEQIIRSAYGSSAEYQSLTLNAIEEWKAWNGEIQSGKTVPPGMTTSDRVFIQNGHLVLTDRDTLPDFEVASIANIKKAGFKDTQLDLTNSSNVQVAERKGLGYAVDPFRRKRAGKSNVGVLDTTGGLGVKFILDPVAGKLQSLCYGHGSSREPSTRKTVIGIKTADDKLHNATITILACGGWTPSLLPALDNLCEATAGSVVLFKLEQGTPLFDRFAPERFPSWQYKMRDGAEGGLYGFPRDENEWLKIGYRGTKYTNPTLQDDGKERSISVTRWSGSEQGGGSMFTAIPAQAVKVVRAFSESHLPVLAENGLDIALTRVCWYTDSFDNHLVIDRVPGKDGLMVATGGSGHAFKYLPKIENWVVDIMEGVGLERDAVKAWRWRKLGGLGGGEAPANVLMEGSKGGRALANASLLTDADLKGKARL